MLGYIGRRNKSRKHTAATHAAAMPELPEVETTRRSVAPSVLGRRIVKLVVYDRRLRWPVPRDLPKRLEGRTVDELSRRSKYLLFRVGDGSLLVHLGMTGSLRAYAKPPARRAHDHVDIVFDDGSLLRYHDPRRFGAMLWAPEPALSHPLLRDLGPEPFDAAFDADYFWRMTRSRSAAIKLALMDSHLVVGVGNIYAN
jgi:formamidopyrimidine-DNA glycosylase